MTEFDRILIKKADALPIRSYERIDDIMFLADTDQAREALYRMRWKNYDIARDSD